MIKLLANAAAALSLLAGASVASPALSAEKKAKCHHVKQSKAKRPIAAKLQPARGVTVVDHRKLDVEILSFGP